VISTSDTNEIPVTLEGTHYPGISVTAKVAKQNHPKYKKNPQQKEFSYNLPVSLRFFI